MDLTAAWEMAKAFFESTPGLLLTGGLIIYALNKVVEAKPKWEKWLGRGNFIKAIKMAEKAIPDKSKNKAVKRFDNALKYLVKAYETKTGKVATDKIKDELGDGISIVHDDIESSGKLAGGK